MDWKEARLKVEKPTEKGGCCWNPGDVMVGTNMMRKIEVGRYTL